MSNENTYYMAPKRLAYGWLAKFKVLALVSLTALILAPLGGSIAALSVEHWFLDAGRGFIVGVFGQRHCLASDYVPFSRTTFF
jgi:hypothetical protein